MAQVSWRRIDVTDTTHADDRNVRRRPPNESNDADHGQPRASTQSATRTHSIVIGLIATRAHAKRARPGPSPATEIYRPILFPHAKRAPNTK